jgi:hypothetical protein
LASSEDNSHDATVKSAFERTKGDRFRFLKSLYDKAAGSEHEWLSRWEISKELGLSEQEVRPLVDYLIGEGLICLRPFDGLIGISHKGIAEVKKRPSRVATED